MAEPISRHYKLQCCRNQPIFLLNVECNTKSYTFSCSGDKDDCIALKDESSITNCILECLHNVFIEFAPKCLWILEENTVQPNSSMVTAEVPTATRADEVNEDQIQSTAPLSQGKNFISTSQIDVLFHHGFLEEELIFPGCSPLKNDALVMDSRSDWRRAVIVSREKCETEAVHNIQFSECLQDIKFVTSYDEMQYPTHESESHSQFDTFLWCDNELGVADATLCSSDLNDDFTTAPHMPIMALNFERQPDVLGSVLLSKEMLAKDLMLLNQVEEKFIITAGNNQILALDQHAIHERILLEEFSVRLKRQLPIRRQVEASVDDNRVIDNHTADFVANSQELLTMWGFQHSILQKMDGLTVIKFNKLPVIENEPLTPDDFIEFIEYALKNTFLPMHLKSPPAVQRILASKACRTAIKFGDKLTTADCKVLLRDIVKCSHPFQCAHGRPSIIPLITLLPKRESFRRRIIHAQQI